MVDPSWPSTHHARRRAFGHALPQVHHPLRGRSVRRYPEPVVAIISKRARRDRHPAYFLCSDTTLSIGMILKYYGYRWQAEVDNWYLKECFGLADYRRAILRSDSALAHPRVRGLCLRAISARGALAEQPQGHAHRLARGAGGASTRASAPDRVLHRGAGTPRAVRCEDLGRPDANVIAFYSSPSHVQLFVIDLPGEVSRGTSTAGSKPIHVE